MASGFYKTVVVIISELMGIMGVSIWHGLCYDQALFLLLSLCSSASSVDTSGTL